MKHAVIVLLTLFAFTGFASPPDYGVQDQVVEKMKITAVRVPVRVYFRGDGVQGLSAEDFRIFEGARQRPLAGFRVIRRKIGEPPPPGSGRYDVSLPPGRLFVLMFKVTHFNEALQDAVEYLFREILGSDDEILLFTTGQTRRYVLKDNRRAVQSDIVTILKSASQKGRSQGQEYIHKLQDLVSNEKYRLKVDSAYGASEMVNFLDDYLQIWMEFKRRFLTPDVERYVNFARYLHQVHREKWVLDFFQMQLFPQLNKASNFFREISIRFASGDGHWARKIRDQLHELELQFRAPVRFPTEEVSDLFYNADATFHSFFIPSTSRIISQDLEYREITTEIETTLREITRKTGGRLVFSGAVRESLIRIREVEDIQYVLFFMPEDPDNIGKVRVEVSDPRYRLAYSSNRSPDYINRYLEKPEVVGPVLEIRRMTFTDPVLHFTVTGLHSPVPRRPPSAELELTVVSGNSNEIRYRQTKKVVVDISRTEFSGEVNLGHLPPGRYAVILTVTDPAIPRTITRTLQVRRN